MSADKKPSGEQVTFGPGMHVALFQSSKNMMEQRCWFCGEDDKEETGAPRLVAVGERDDVLEMCPKCAADLFTLMGKFYMRAFNGKEPRWPIKISADSFSEGEAQL